MENIKSFFNKKSINFFYPIALILAIVPLVVRVTTVNVDSDTAAIYGKAVQVDLFSQKKASILLFFSVILIVITAMFFKRIFEKKDKLVNMILVSCTVFWTFTLLSTIFSAHKNYSILGAVDRAEGFITITCYMILFIYSLYTFKNTANYKYILIPVFILVVIEAFLGVFQFFGNDLINSKLGLLIVLGDTTRKLSLMYQSGKLYGTLFHYDYMGSFVAIVLPILFSLTIFEKKGFTKIILGLGSLLSIWLLLGSSSRSGIIGVFVAIILGILLFSRMLLKKWRFILLSFISLIIILIGLNFVTKGSIFERIPSLLTDITSISKDTSNFDYAEHTPIKDIKHVDGHVEVVLPNETIKISYENKKYVFKNSKDEIIPYTLNDNIYTMNDEAFKNISFNTKKITANLIVPDELYLRVDNQPMFLFSLKKDNSLHLESPTGKKDVEISTPETFGFKGKEQLGSGRGYIWSRSIPLLKNNLIIGGGPDTFIYQFPQNDFIAKYYTYGNPNIVVDKPHDLYLQVALNEGIIGFLAFLAIMLIYIIDSIRLYAFKKQYDDSQILGISNCLGVVGYLFAGFFNDSIISVAPVFWIILGVGVAINYLNRTELAKKNV